MNVIASEGQTDAINEIAFDETEVISWESDPNSKEENMLGQEMLSDETEQWIEDKSEHKSDEEKIVIGELTNEVVLMDEEIGGSSEIVETEDDLDIKHILEDSDIKEIETELSVQYADVEESVVSIDNTVLRVGDILSVANPNGYLLKFFIDDEYVSDEFYTLSKNDYEKWIGVKAYDGNSLVGEDKVWFSKLPVMYIDTDDGKAVTSKEEYKTSKMILQGNEIFAQSDFLYNGSMQIKGRGNSTWSAPKKPYRIKLDSKSNLLNMGKNKNWVLLANYLDSSLMKNKLSYDFSGELGLAYMQSEMVDLVINGNWMGTYQLCEQVRIDENRINIFDWEKLGENIAASIAKAESLSKEQKSQLINQMEQNLSWIDTQKVFFDGVEYIITDYYSDIIPPISGGYLIEFDGWLDETSVFMANGEIPTMLKSPEYLNTSEMSKDYLQKYIEAFDDALFAENFYVESTGSNKHYSELTEMNSLIGYWLTSELFFNIEGEFKSTYAYKDIDDLLMMGPIWDMDTSIGYQHTATRWSKYDKWRTNEYGVRWDKKITSDPYFIIKAQEKYWKVRNSVIEDLVRNNGTIDLLAEYLQESGDKNFKSWGIDNNYFNEINSFVDATDSVKEWLINRVNWLDEQFATEQSLVDSLGNYKASDKFEIIANNLLADTISEHAKAQGILTDDELSLSISNISGDISNLQVYINGLKWGTPYVVSSDSVDITIPAEDLPENGNKKNVIAIFGMGGGTNVGSNYLTVIKSDAENLLYDATPYKYVDDVLSYDVTVPHVIINQMYGADRDGYGSHSFIELYNPTDNVVNLDGWALYYQSAPGGDYNGEWEKLPLNGTINAHSSFLVRCKAATKSKEITFNVTDGDMEWSSLKMYNKGGTVLLSYRNDDIAADAPIYNNDQKCPLIKGYVDMLAVSGNDTDTEEDITKETAPWSEGIASQEQSKKKSIRRKAFVDSDDNSTKKTGDCEIIDYSFGAQAYLDWAKPRRSADGPWGASDTPKYTVTLHLNDGNDSTETKTFAFTKKVKVDDPVREGYTFTGWYTDPECSTAFDSKSEPTTDVELYAGWSINIYTVKFLNEDGSERESKSVEYGRFVARPTDLVKEGYTFIGWKTEAGNGVLYDFDNPVSEDVTLSPVWEIITYQVSFLNEDGSEYANQTVDHGQRVVEPANPEKTGYTFTGWRTGGENDSVYDFNAAVVSGLTLYASWKINTYTVSFLNEDGSEYVNQLVNYGQKASIPEKPIKEGYTFIGWKVEGEVGDIYDFDQLVSADIILSPVWSLNTYKVTFLNEDGSEYASQMVDRGQKVVKPADPEKAGYTFIGWKQEDENEAVYDFNSLVVSELTLRVSWKINTYKVTYLNEDGSEYVSQLINYGQKASKPQEPVKTGYTFIGWKTEKDSESLYDFEKAVSADVTLYAGFKINTYTISFLNEDGSEYNVQKLDYNQKITEPETPVKAGYNFTGWKTDGENGDYCDFDKPVTGNMTYYANWSAVLQKMSTECVIEGRLEQSVNTISEYKITLTPADVPYTAIALEKAGSERIKVELIDGVLRVDTTDAMTDDIVTVKIYDTVISTDEARRYVPDGSFTVSAVLPHLFLESRPDVMVKGSDDVSFTLSLVAPEPEQIEKFVNGKFVYKVDVIPYPDEAGNVPDGIAQIVKQPYYIEKTEKIQQEEIIVNKEEYTNGQAWKYDIKVSLLLVWNDASLEEIANGDAVLFTSKENILTAVETREVQKDQLADFSLQDLDAIIHTGQSGIAAAKVVWDEVKSEIGEVRDITPFGKGTTGGRVKAWEADGNIMISAPKGAEPGIHTIEVVAYGTDHVHKVRHTVEVVVFRGIESLYVEVSTTQLYKQPGKKAQMTAALKWNEESDKPAIKSAVWQITDVDGQPLLEGSPLYGHVKISKGKVTVDKKLKLSNNSDENRFRILAKADDFASNAEYALSDVIEISEVKLSIGRIILVTYDNANSVYKTVDTSEPLTLGRMKYAQFIALREGASDKETYTKEELLQDRLPSKAVNWKVSNKKMSIEQSGDSVYLKTGQTVGTVTITALAVDGGKNKAELKLNLAYEKPVEMALGMAALTGKDLMTSLADVDTPSVNFAGTTNTMIRLTVNAKDTVDSMWTPLWEGTDHSVKISGGKILAADLLKGEYDVIVTGAKATVTLQDKLNGKRKAYTIANTSYSKAAAPKVKLSGNIIAGSRKNRTVTIKLSGSYKPAGKSVIIETDAASRMSSNNSSHYTLLERSADVIGNASTVAENGKITMNFDSTFLYAGKYKLKLTFGTVDENGVFIADAKPATVSLKVKAPKAVKGSFKPVTKYKVKAELGANATLKGSGKKVKEYTFKRLENVVSKKKENEFLKYFELRNDRLCLREDLTQEDLAYLKKRSAKKDLTGYVTYTAYHGDNGYGVPYVTVKRVKITVKIFG